MIRAGSICRSTSSDSPCSTTLIELRHEIPRVEARASAGEGVREDGPAMEARCRGLPKRRGRESASLVTIVKQQESVV